MDRDVHHLGSEQVLNDNRVVASQGIDDHIFDTVVVNDRGIEDRIEMRGCAARSQREGVSCITAEEAEDVPAVISPVVDVSSITGFPNENVETRAAEIAIGTGVVRDSVRIERRVAEDVVAFFAVQVVVATSANQNVIAGATVDVIHLIRTDQGVIAVTAKNRNQACEDQRGEIDAVVTPLCKHLQ